MGYKGQHPGDPFFEGKNVINPMCFLLSYMVGLCRTFAPAFLFLFLFLLGSLASSSSSSMSRMADSLAACPRKPEKVSPKGEKVSARACTGTIAHRNVSYCLRVGYTVAVTNVIYHKRLHPTKRPQNTYTTQHQRHGVANIYLDGTRVPSPLSQVV